MKRDVLLVILTSLFTLILGSQLNLFPMPISGQDVTVPQLRAEEVLSIIARPLPVDSPRGYFLVNVNVSYANLIGVDLTRAQLDFADFSNVDFDYAVLSSVSGNYTNFSNSSFGSADLQDANLHYSDFTNAKFANANLRNASLGDSDFTSATFLSASLYGTNFYAADISDADFLGAIFEDVVLPDGSVYEAGRDLVADFGAASNPGLFSE